MRGWRWAPWCAGLADALGTKLPERWSVTVHSWMLASTAGCTHGLLRSWPAAPSLTPRTELPKLPSAHSRDLYEKVFSACGGVYWNATEGSPCDRALDRVWHAGWCPRSVACLAACSWLDSSMIGGGLGCSALRTASAHPFCAPPRSFCCSVRPEHLRCAGVVLPWAQPVHQWGAAERCS